MTKPCVDFSTANYLAQRVDWSQLTLIFGREWNYKNFSKSFLQFFLRPNTRYLDTYSTRERWPTVTLYLSWRKWNSAFRDQTMCWFYGCELFSSKGSPLAFDPCFWSTQEPGVLHYCMCFATQRQPGKIASGCPSAEVRWKKYVRTPLVHRNSKKRWCSIRRYRTIIHGRPRGFAGKLYICCYVILYCATSSAAKKAEHPKSAER